MVVVAKTVNSASKQSDASPSRATESHGKKTANKLKQPQTDKGTRQLQ
jgi:hypothetical protein